MSGIFVSKVTSAGAAVYTKSYSNDSFFNALQITPDPTGNVLVSGAFWSTLEGQGLRLSSPTSLQDAFVMKLDPAGNQLYARRYGTAIPDLFFGAATDSQGRAVLQGTFGNAIDFGGGPVSGNGSVVLLKLNP